MKRNILKIILIVLGFTFIIKNNYYQRTISTPINYNLKGVLKKDFYAILSIPKINLKQEFFDINSEYNSVNYGIEIIRKTDNLLILAAHSGNSKISYFKRLAELVKDDKVVVTYENKEDIYKIVYYYEIEKNNTFQVLNDGILNKIILITCHKRDKTKQIVYVGELVE